MNLKALQKAFMMEANRLIKGVSKDNMYVPMDIQIDRTVKQLYKNYDKLAPNDPLTPVKPEDEESTKKEE